MPFTPFHLGPSASISLPLHKYLDVPLFLLANFIIDLEPFIVMIFNLNYPLHGYCHTFLIGSIIGCLGGFIGYLLKDIKSKELANAIRQVNNGQIVTSKSMSQKDRFLPEAEQVDDETIRPNSLEELQMIIPPPVEANQLMRLSGRIEHSLNSRVLQVIGSWEEGTIMTIALDKISTLPDILEILKSIPEVQRVSEDLPVSAISPKLLEKAQAVPRVNNRIRKTVFVTLDKN